MNQNLFSLASESISYKLVRTAILKRRFQLLSGKKKQLPVYEICTNLRSIVRIANKKSGQNHCDTPVSRAPTNHLQRRSKNEFITAIMSRSITLAKTHKNENLRVEIRKFRENA